MTADGQEGFRARLGVSRETIERLRGYEALLRKWNPAINLVSPSTLADVWSRHFLDSAQLFKVVSPQAGLWADLGAGGGFPGLVIAILAQEQAPDLRLTLVESDKRKSAFLATVSRELSLGVTVLPERIEAVSPLGADYLSARALAPLTVLLGFAERHLAPGGIGVFPKGGSWRQELAEARENWSFACSSHPSDTDPEAAILTITEVSRV